MTSPGCCPPQRTDNSVKIAQIQAILRAGAVEVVVDGQTVRFDFDVLRQQLRDLMLTDSSGNGANARRRPIAAQVYLGGF